MSFSLISHIYMHFVLLKTTIPSFLTKSLLYVQCWTDGLYAVLVIVQTNTKNFTPASNTVPVDPILCCIFQSGTMSIFLRATLGSNILCQSIDRFLALVYPNTYRMHAKYYIISYVIIIPVYSLLASIPRFVKTSLDDGSCLLKGITTNPYLLPIIETLLCYGIPTSIFIPISAVVIRKIRQLHLSTFGSSNGDRSLPDNGNSDKTAINNSLQALMSIQKSLFLNNLFVTARLTLTECTYMILSVLNIRGILRYDAGALVRVYFLCAIVCLDSLDPVLNMMTINALRNTVIIHIKIIYEFYRKARQLFELVVSWVLRNFFSFLCMSNGVVKTIMMCSWNIGIGIQAGKKTGQSEKIITEYLPHTWNYL